MLDRLIKNRRSNTYSANLVFGKIQEAGYTLLDSDYSQNEQMNTYTRTVPENLPCCLCAFTPGSLHYYSIVTFTPCLYTVPPVKLQYIQCLSKSIHG